MRFEILGPIQLRAGEREIIVPIGRERALLATLLVRANRLVFTDTLIDAIWDTEAPHSARNQVQRCVHRLRQRLTNTDDDRPTIVTEATGYRLRIDPTDLDLLEFRRHVAAARNAAKTGKTDEAADQYRAALGLWRGPALADVDSLRVRRDAAALDEEHVQVLEERFDAELAAGGEGELVAELTNLVQQHPYREKLHRALMLALYRAGRVGDALAAYRRARDLLRDDLGVEPGSELQQLHRAILNRDPNLHASRPAETATTAPSTPRELPADVAGFTGRVGVLRELDGLLPGGEDEPAPVVISAIAGTAGVGKTALAVRWAHRVTDQFPHGQLYINLRGYATDAPLRPIEALSTLLRSLGIPSDQIPTREEEASARYRSLLTDRRVLIVLDNARSADQVRPLLPGSPGCLALVTSRDRLAGLVAKDGAQRITLDVLTSDEAYELLTRLLGAERVSAEPEAAAELAKACAYLPLALRIAAAILQDPPHRHIAALASELTTGPRLAALEVPDDQAAAVRAALDLSYRAIPEPAQRLFRLLGLVPGPDVTPPAAAALADLTEHEARRLLDRLATAHLIEEHAPDRYTFHDLLREYARDRASLEEGDSRQAKAVEQLLSWYLEATHAITDALYRSDTPIQHPANEVLQTVATVASRGHELSWLDAERPNLVAAVTHAAGHGYHSIAVLLADLLRLYLWNGMHSLDGLVVGRASLTAAQAGGDHNDEAAALLSLADAHLMCGDHREAAESYRRASAMARRAGWLRGEASAENNLATVHMDRGQLREADQHLTRSLALHRRLGQPAFQALSLGNLGYVQCDLGNISGAIDLWNETLAIFRRLEHTRGIGISLANLGRASHILGRLGEAQDLLAQALQLLRQVGDRGGESYALRLMTAIDRDTGRVREGLAHADLAFACVRDTVERRLESDVWNVMAGLHHSLGDYGNAITCYERAHEVARSVPFQRAEALIGLGSTRHRLGQHEQARDHATEALEVAHEVGYRVLEGQALTVLADIALSQGATGDPDVRALASQALENHRSTGHQLGEARALAILGRCQATGDLAAAERCWRAAYKLFDEIGAPVPADVTQGLQVA